MIGFWAPPLSHVHFQQIFLLLKINDHSSEYTRLTLWCWGIKAAWLPVYHKDKNRTKPADSWYPAILYYILKEQETAFNTFLQHLKTIQIWALKKIKVSSHVLTQNFFIWGMLVLFLFHDSSIAIYNKFYNRENFS